MAYIRVPPDGAGKKVYTVTQTVSGESVESQVTHIADPLAPTQYLKIDNQGSASIRFAEGQPPLAGFGYLKTATQRVLGVYESSQGSYDDLFTIVTGNGGLSTYDSVGNGQILSTSTASGSRCFRQTNRYHYYVPGSANYILMTIACGDLGKSNNVRRWGAFDEKDGVFFSLEGTTLYAVVRSSTTGTVVETKVAQSSWNKDKVDGTGLSGFDLDLTKINLWWIDYQWLGSGRVRFGVFTPSGSRIVCHQFENAGVNTLPYMRSGTLPLATENINSNITASTSELRESCMAMYTEGTYEDYTFWRYSDIDVENHNITGEETPVCFIRSKATLLDLDGHNSITVYPEYMNIWANSTYKICMYQDVGDFTGSWGLTDPSSTLEAITGNYPIEGRPFHCWYINSGISRFDLTPLFEVNDEGIHRNADETSEVWAISAMPIGESTGGKISLNLAYRELW